MEGRLRCRLPGPAGRQNRGFIVDTIVIIGAGLAGATAATALRDNGHRGPIVLFGKENHVPYERPPLSKGYLLGKDPIEKAFVHPEEWYGEHDIDLRLGQEVTAIDRQARVVRTADGEQAYARLLLALGAEPRHLKLADEAGVPTACLRTIEDSDRIRAALGSGKRLVIIGAGWIGLEVAAAARQAGTDVTVFETADLPLLRVLGPEVATIFADLHREHGVDLRLGTSVTAADLSGADLVVVGIGAVPVTRLAEEAGLEVDNGILVDSELRTADPDIYAIGDIANHAHPTLGRRIRVEHWDTAIEQGKVAAQNLAGGHVAYERMPYFFTDQYDLGMEYVGHAGPGADVILAGDPGGRVFRAYWIEDGIVTAAMHANDWDAIGKLRAAIGKPLMEVER